MALTVAQIADLIRRPNADKAAVIERLRAWGDAGLLTPEGDLNPGTGRPRMYANSVAFDAAILNALADVGIPIGKQRYFMNVLLCADRAKTVWAKGPHPGLFLEIADFGEPNPQGGTHAVFLHEGKHKGRLSHLGDLIHPRAEGSFVLNVSKLFARIEARLAESKKGPPTSAVGKKPRVRERKKVEA